MLVQPTKPTETILGYTLREKIGSGGYGEVWAAEAPGGLTKAIKLIFGYHDEGRAQRELKALNRIKQVRHPFLLSLERIDVVDGRLVVVTELAEQSLKDRFRKCVNDGAAGIPREELLGYLADAAEALDYIYKSHSLLHLDVKPENLLLVGGHVKLADFGLVKDVEESFQSMMGGLTPTYAAPEVFDGQPGRASDQYSLAIVFQEMLTGNRPFRGTTPAKLALQHLHEPPDLSNLTPGDQGPVRRALAKSPEARFPECRAFVDDLLQRRSRPRRRKADPADSKNNESTPVDTFANTIASQGGGISQMAKKLIEEKLPPLDISVRDATFQPVLFIGVGETATTVLRHLKRRLQDRLGDSDKCSALRVLCLDTDTRNLDEAVRGNDMGRLDADEVLALPLKTPAEYREHAASHLTWLSRRWIYNIPRSLQTEGLRPLGRLAFVDHHDKVFDRLHRVIGQITDADAVSRTAGLCEMPAGDSSPKVFIVASISGGVGSGMVADLAYTVRMVLAERGLKEYPVHGVLLTSSGGANTRREIKVANTYCCLNELYHYSHVHGYPGDPSCDLPAFEDCPTFDETYLIDMGSDPLADEYTALADVLAEYLFLDSATPCGHYFSTCREDNLLIDEGMYLRTLGLSHSGGLAGDAVSLSAQTVGHQVVRNWLRSPAQIRQDERIQRMLPDVLAELTLDVDQLTSKFRDVLTAKLQRDPLDLLQQELEVFSHDDRPLSDEGQTVSLRAAVEEAADNALGLGRRPTASARNRSLKAVADVAVNELIAELSQYVNAVVADQLNCSGSRLGLAEAIHLEVVDLLDKLAERAVATQRLLREQLGSVMEQLENGDNYQMDSSQQDDDTRGSVADAVRQYGQLRLHELFSSYIKRVVAGLREQMEVWSHKLAGIRRDLSQLADELDPHGSGEDGQRMLAAVTTQTVISSAFVSSTTADLESLTLNVDQVIQQQYFGPLGGFVRSQEICGRAGNSELKQALFRHARSLIAARIQVIGLDSLLQRQGVDEDSLAQWVDESLKLATPNLLTLCGGKSRLLVALPRGSQDETLAAAFADKQRDQPRFMCATDGDISFCYEVGNIPILQVAALLLQSCPRSIDLVSRVHTRTDVNWNPLIRLE